MSVAKQSAKQKQRAKAKRTSAVAEAAALAEEVGAEHTPPAPADDVDAPSLEEPIVAAEEGGEEPAGSTSLEERSKRWSVRVVDQDGGFYAFFLDESCAQKWLRRNPGYRLAVGEEGRAPRRRHEADAPAEAGVESGAVAASEAAGEDARPEDALAS